MDADNITLVSVFAAGVVSFLSPCVLPLLPTYTAFLAGTGASGRGGGKGIFYLNAALFLSGFTLIFILMGATASYFGQFFFEYQHIIRKAGALFMAVMGVHMMGLIRMPGLHREYRPLLNNAFQGPLGAFLLGMAFTAGWTPCTGPILATILIYAGTTATLGQGAFLLFVYAMGFCVPFLIIAILLNRYVSRFRSLYHWLPRIQQVSGAVLLMAGILIYFDLMQKGLGILWNLFE